MKLIILGSGTGVPLLHRHSPGYYVETENYQFQVDCGSGSMRQLEHAGKSYKTLDAVFFTHTHPDHIGDLIPLIHALKVTPGFRREKPLNLFGPPGFAEFFNNFVAPVVKLPKHFSIAVQEVTRGFEVADLRGLTTPTVHSDYLNSVAYRFEQANRSLTLSGDCDYDSGIIALSREADLAVLDCSFPHALKVEGHLSATQCGEIAEQAGVKRLILSHLYPVSVAQDTRLAEARAACAAEVQLAEDLLEIEL
jgi:ribonuclease BN (tRNA processing enzyme)